MIKLVVSDIDGTLIPYGEKGLPSNLFDLIRRLRRAGVAFCPASGRQYYSLRRLFAPVAEEMYFLSENGGAVFGPGELDTAPVLSSAPFPRDTALALIRDIVSQAGCPALISGPRQGYVCGGYPSSLAYNLEVEIDCRVKRVADPADIPGDIVKISAYCANGTDEPAKVLGPRWKGWNMAVAGPNWLDFGLAHKGSGVLGLCKALGIAPEEVAAFGDNWNDVSMLRAVGQPYLMETAHPDLRAQFPRQCSSVTAVLEEMLAQLEK